MEDLGVNRRIILKLILKKQDVRTWTGLIWLRIGSSGRLFNESLHYVVFLVTVVVWRWRRRQQWWPWLLWSVRLLLLLLLLMMMMNSHREDWQKQQKYKKVLAKRVGIYFYCVQGVYFIQSSVVRIAEEDSVCWSCCSRVPCTYMCVCDKSQSCWVSHILATWDLLLRRFVSAHDEGFSYNILNHPQQNLSLNKMSQSYSINSPLLWNLKPDQRVDINTPLLRIMNRTNLVPPQMTRGSNSVNRRDFIFPIMFIMGPNQPPI